MTRKDYIRLAAAFYKSRPVPEDRRRSQWEWDCGAISDALRSDNPRFDREKFLTACGYFNPEA